MPRKDARPAVADVSDLSHDGKGVVRDEGKTVFVAGALPGEVVEFQRVKRRRSYDEATTLRVIEPSEHRVTPRCEVFGICGGCALQHLDHGEQVKHKHAVLIENLRRIAKTEADELALPVMGPIWNYRGKARLGVKFVTKKDRVLVGFRERLKPYITDMSACPILTDDCESLPGQLAELISGLSIASELPQVEVAVGDGATALVFRVLQPPSAEDLDAFSQFAVARNVRVYLQPGGLDTVQPLETWLAGSAAVAQSLLHYGLDDNRLQLEFAPTDFVQVNRALNETLVALAMELLAIQPGDRVLDLFCGIGNFSLPIARRAAAVTGVEGAQVLVDRARSNAKLNNLNNADFIAANLEKLEGTESWLGKLWDLVLLDPARAGALEMLPFLDRIGPRRIVYVACHPGTLARDIGVLVHEFGFRLRYARIVDMFPHTAHVESIAVLER